MLVVLLARSCLSVFWGDVKLPKELREMVLRASVEAVRESIPSGKSRITDR
jgi:hypothetical protein